MNWFLYALTAAIFSALAALTEKKLLVKMHPVVMTCVFTLFTVPMVWWLFSLSPALIINLKPMIWAVVFVKSLFEATQFYCVMRSIKTHGLSSTLPWMVLVPALVAILAYFLLHELLTTNQILGLILMTIGIAVTQIKSKPTWNLPIVIALAAATGAALMDKTILSAYKVPANIFLFTQQMMLVGLFGIGWLLTGKSTKKNSFSFITISWLLGLAFLTIIYRYCQMKGVQLAPVSLVLSVRRSSVVIATLLSGALFKEKNVIKKAIGAVVMVVGAYFLASSV